MIKSKKGFTLPELLIVVAIIAVLVAISIPIFSTQLEKSREATDLANVRNAYSNVMMAVMSKDTASHNGVTYIHDRWYQAVDLKQKVAGWQTDGTLTIGGVSSTDSFNWVGAPSPGGRCLVSYTEEHGAVFAWEYNFAQIMNHMPISGSDYAQYNGKTVTQLIHEKSFTMLESSGSTGQYITSQIKHQLGMKDTDAFAYKILPAKDYGKDYYMIFISDSSNLKSNVTANQSKVGEIEVTGYVYQIREDGSSILIKEGTKQVISTYSNGSSQEKMDVFGNQDNCSTIKDKANNTPYSWDL